MSWLQFIYSEWKWYSIRMNGRQMIFYISHEIQYIEAIISLHINWDENLILHRFVCTQTHTKWPPFDLVLMNVVEKRKDNENSKKIIRISTVTRSKFIAFNFSRKNIPEMWSLNKNPMACCIRYTLNNGSINKQVVRTTSAKKLKNKIDEKKVLEQWIHFLRLNFLCMYLFLSFSVFATYINASTRISTKRLFNKSCKSILSLYVCVYRAYGDINDHNG